MVSQPRQALPTMYDLPSEDPNEPGLPDEFHALQPQLLSATLRLRRYAPDAYFTGMDLNLYYDPDHTLWHKRPDWFLALGVPRLYAGHDLRLSYVVWQEQVSPFIVVELLSPGTEAEDLGDRTSQPGQPPSKWQVYEQILQVPYYFIFDRYTNQFRGFQCCQGRYQPLELAAQRFWLPELELGLGVWQGNYQGITRPWLRWYTEDEVWLPTPEERAIREQQRADLAQQQADQARQRAELAQQQVDQARQQADLAQQQIDQARQRAELAQQQIDQERQRAEQAESQVAQIARNLAQTGMSLADIAQMTGQTVAQLQAWLAEE
ncbi:MAG: Uma2 family endonuclease [Spirulinaceae cyanobacterium RM2_2_10]|nr:Uma2 family endonuclease [Spirulinaceae cyanobacterium SM2_1_0]NJO19706.1 Uma2 family endonuclease [Spirulinaceae cyanobacterium RM2_2_10]